MINPSASGKGRAPFSKPMLKNKWVKSGVLGAALALVGLLGGPHSRLMHDLEENLGLRVLFQMRGKRSPPPQVVVVAIDQASANRLGVPNNPQLWPRKLHARLITALTEHGVSAIAFDLFFDDLRDQKDALSLSTAMKNAGNVVLVGRMTAEDLPAPTEGGAIRIERIIPPAPSFENAIQGVAPWPLPIRPQRVSRYWKFKPEAGDTPVMPVLLFQQHTLQAHDHFIRLLKSAVAAKGLSLGPLAIEDKAGSACGRLGPLISQLRELFSTTPGLQAEMLHWLDNDASLRADQVKDLMIRRLLTLYAGSETSYLNYYGPLRTITTIPYADIIDNQTAVDLQGKAVLVGFSENVQTLQRDHFNTVFSQEDGLDLSGVEIGATAFANLLDGSEIIPLKAPLCIMLLVLLGIVFGMLALARSPTFAATSIVLTSTLYLLLANQLFTTTYLWLPLVTPLLVMAPLAFVGGFTWDYMAVRRERGNIRKAFSLYLPESLVEALAQDHSLLRAHSKVVYGVCLYTDAEHYTKLSEKLDPVELSTFMNRYFQVVFTPVRAHGGMVSNIVADAVLAVWVVPEMRPEIKTQACRAAVGITAAIERFNRENPTQTLPTRIGIHAGGIVLGNFGAVDHYEYRPVGDIVNTATRLEGLNKYLGTRMLVSAQAYEKVEGMSVRDVGRFIFVGKTLPLQVFELLEGNETELCNRFNEALQRFQAGELDAASRSFKMLMQHYPQDGPSHFYSAQCDACLISPPLRPWDGNIRLQQK